MTEVLDLSSKTIEEIFTDKNIRLIYVHKAIKELLSDYEYVFDDLYDTEDNELISNKYIIQIIYESVKCKLLLSCKNNCISLDFCYGNILNDDYVSLEKFRISKNINNYDEIAFKILEYIEDIIANNPNMEYCRECSHLFLNDKPRSKLFEKYCNTCEITRFFNCQKYIHSDVKCDICMCPILEKNKNNLIEVRDIRQIVCCKDKYICMDCIEHINKSCECGACNETKCPFCKQDLEIVDTLT